MVAISDFMNEATPGAPVRMVDAARMIGRAVQSTAGAGFVAAAFALWLWPGAAWSGEIALMKMGLSLGLGFVGLALLQSGHVDGNRELQIDADRGEVRLVRRARHNGSVLACCSFEELGRAEMQGEMVRLWDMTGRLIAEVPLSDPDTRRNLIDALRTAGKL